MTVLNYLLDPANAGRHRQWQELEAAKKQKRISARKLKRLESMQARLVREAKNPPKPPKPIALKVGHNGHTVQVFSVGASHRGIKVERKSKPKPVAKTASKEPPQFPTYTKGMPSSEFYRTREWMAVRYEILRRYGAVCMCCSATKVTMHVDHIKPRSKFPALELDSDNLQVLCHACNIGKSNTDHTDWRTKGSITQTG